MLDATSSRTRLVMGGLRSVEPASAEDIGPGEYGLLRMDISCYGKKGMTFIRQAKAGLSSVQARLSTIHVALFRIKTPELAAARSISLNRIGVEFKKKADGDFMHSSQITVLNACGDVVYKHPVSNNKMFWYLLKKKTQFSFQFAS